MSPAAHGAAWLAMLAGLAPLGAQAQVLARGAEVFKGHCMQCHGSSGGGDGPLAARYDPRPSNLRASTRTEEYMMQIVTLGGAALGRSSVMPEWGLELSGPEILAVVEYVSGLRNRGPAR